VSVRTQLCGTLALWVGILLVTTQAVAATYPLDPLTQDEIATTVRVLTGAGTVTESTRFHVLALQEPPKQQVLHADAGAAPPREAFAVLFDNKANKTFEAVVDCSHAKLVSWKQVAGVQPPLTLEEIKLTQAIVRADPVWQAAMRHRGITDFEHIQVDPWSAGYYNLPGEEGRRVVRGLSYYNAGSVNPYARPIEGVVAYVDLNARKVFKLIDTGVVPVPRATADIDEHSVGQLREDLKPLEITQPQGANFVVNGHEVTWQKWHFRFAMHPRDGLVLYTVSYQDKGKLRSILYRAGLSEMVVPYGDPGPAWFFRNAFDEGEYGIGHMADSFKPETDAPANAEFFDTTFADERGNAFDIPRTVALYERDGGILWKHVDEMTQKNESRRARELVLGWIATVGNYEYAFNWVFAQDGTLSMEIALTGIMEPKAVSDATQTAMLNGHPAYGSLVSKNIVAPNHQHFFNFRLDMDVDGVNNSVVEMNVVPGAPGRANPYSNAFRAQETVFRKEMDGQRNLNPDTARMWSVVNPSVKNALGEPVGYSLMPEENAVPYAAPASSVRKRAGFASHQLWVTPYDPSEMHAAGEYVYQSKGGEGLPRWTQANRSIENHDVVLWYTVGVTHIPRPEDWPVMPVFHTGFELVPTGFFDRNPALDVPRNTPNR
jgi:primary-amine oxidase